MVLEKVPSVVLLSSTELKEYSSKYNTIFNKHFQHFQCITSLTSSNDDPSNINQFGAPLNTNTDNDRNTTESKASQIYQNNKNNASTISNVNKCNQIDYSRNESLSDKKSLECHKNQITSPHNKQEHKTCGSNLNWNGESEEKLQYQPEAIVSRRPATPEGSAKINCENSLSKTSQISKVRYSRCQSSPALGQQQKYTNKRTTNAAENLTEKIINLNTDCIPMVRSLPPFQHKTNDNNNNNNNNNDDDNNNALTTAPKAAAIVRTGSLKMKFSSRNTLIKKERCSSLKYIREKPLKVCHLRRLSAPIKFQEFKTLNQSPSSSLQSSPFIFQNNFKSETVNQNKQHILQKRTVRKHSCKPLRCTLTADLALCKHTQRTKDRLQQKKARTKSLDSFDAKTEISFQVKRVSKVAVDTLKSFPSHEQVSSKSSGILNAEKLNKNQLRIDECSEQDKILAGENTNLHFHQIEVNHNKSNNVLTNKNNNNNNTNIITQPLISDFKGNSTHRGEIKKYFDCEKNEIDNSEIRSARNNIVKKCEKDITTNTRWNLTTRRKISSCNKVTVNSANAFDANNNKKNTVVSNNCNSKVERCDNKNRKNNNDYHYYDRNDDIGISTEYSLMEAAKHIQKFELQNNKNLSESKKFENVLVARNNSMSAPEVEEQNDDMSLTTHKMLNSKVDWDKMDNNNIDLRHHEKFIKNLENINGINLKSNRSSLIMLTSATSCCQQRRQFSGSKERRKLSSEEIERLTKRFTEKHLCTGEESVSSKVTRRRRKKSEDKYKV